MNTWIYKFRFFYSM